MTSRMAVLCIIVAFLAAVSSAAHSSPAPAADCSNLVMKMADCLDFVSEGSKTTKPEGNCCSGLKTVLKTDAECLCQTFRNAGQFGVKLNNTKALTLPAACHVSAPSISNCGLSIGTGAAPAMSPVVGAPANSIGSGPAPAPGKSSGASVVGPIGLLVVAASLTLL